MSATKITVAKMEKILRTICRETGRKEVGYHFSVNQTHAWLVEKCGECKTLKDVEKTIRAEFSNQ